MQFEDVLEVVFELEEKFISPKICMRYFDLPHLLGLLNVFINN